MKTILYQPLFINPQAYFVFPQLYHIEKGDSYIEPANITGQLIINDLTKVLTSTPILNVVQDTNQVDFGLFKGKHIRISQYTNIGAVVLGEWYIPGTPTPPEPEQPDWFKESIVAWYSPYCKQRMTNYDVIEAYVEDFTRFNHYAYRGSIDRTPNKIVITESKTDVLNIIENINTSTNDIVIKVTGVSEELKLFVQDINSVRQYISKDGVYKFTNNSYQYFGFGINKVISGINVVIEQLPTSILKDYSGNGNHAYLYGSKGKLNSGMGVYKEDFTTWNYVPERGDVTRSYNTIHITKVTNTVTANIISKTNEFGNSITLKIVGATSDNPLMVGTYSKPNGYTAISKDGVYSFEIDEQYWGFRFNKDGDVNVTITQIPDYPDQLCYDDKMYAVAYDMPILTDYTVIAERTWFEKKGAFIVKGSSPNNGFVFERIDGSLERVQSLGAWNTITINTDSVVSYLTKNKYNNSNIKNGIGVDEDVLCIGGSYQKETNNINIPFIGCHGNILLFNRSLTEYEISWVKNNMMCSKPQEPDKDDILKSLVVHYNIGKQGSNSIKSTNTLTDYSGNNRHATCKNFNWVNTQFVDDGKAMRFDSNGSCIVGINMPQLDKYTIIAKRRWIDKKSENKWFCSLGNGDYNSASQSLFWFEGGLLNNVFYTYNKGYKNPIVLPELISIQSSDDYNGVRINSSNGVQAGNKLFIGSVGENDNTHVVADFYQLLLFDRVLTDEEREWVKENLIEPDTVSAAKACTALFEPENLEITDEYPTGIIRDSLGGDYYMVAHSDDYTIENGLMKSTDDTFLVSIENANENDIKAMIIDMYYDSTVPGSYLNGEYTEGSVKLTNRRIMGINNPTTTSIFQDLMQVLETGFTIGKVALYNKELTKDEFDSEAFHKGFAVRHSTFEKNASTHLFRDGHKELTPGEYLLPFETLYLRVDVPEGYTMQDYVFDEIEQSWKPNTPKSYICPEHDFHIIAMGEQMKVIKNWSPLASISTFGFRATDNQIEFAGSTDGGTMTYILDDTDVTKFTIQYTNTAGKGNVYLIIGDRQYDVISGQPQTYSISGAVKLDFLNMEEVTNFAGTIKFTNVV